MQSKNILCVIPARYASERLPGKPLVLIKGMPLVQWVYERATEASVFKKVVVATDERRVADAVAGFGGMAVMTSPAHTSGTDRVNEVAQNESCEFIVNLQGDEPLMPRSLLQEFAAGLASLVDDNSLLTCVSNATIEEAENPNAVKAVLNAQGEALYFSRSPIPFVRDKSAPVELLKHVGIYGFTKGSIGRFCALPKGHLEQCEKLEQLRALEYGMKIHCLMVRYTGFGIDTAQDVEKFRALVER
jgi:3-deoxy-manno-octulosonate cytidylyltransferase (CMP-KDO synthetase)